MKNLNKYKVILKEIKKGSIPFKDYSNGIFELDSIGLDKYFLNVDDSIETIQSEIKFYQKQVKEYQNVLHANRHKLVWNWMNI